MARPEIEIAYIAFAGDRCVASGSPRDVISAIKQTLGRDPQASVLVFNGATGDVIDIDYRGSIEEILARLVPVAPVAQVDEASHSAPRGPGRPKLGVVAREVTLLPRHWEWLARQRGGASVALRRLVDEARHAHKDKDRIKVAQEATYRFMAAMAANKPHYDEVARALFAGDAAKFEALLISWPKDVRDHVRRLAEAVFQPEPSSEKRGA